MRIDDVMTFRVKSKPKKYPVNKEKKMFYSKRRVYHAILRGDFNPESIEHRICRDVLIAEGYIDKELNVLREWL